MFGKKVRLFRLMGFEVFVDASWLILALLVTWTLAAGYFPFVIPGLKIRQYVWMGVGGTLGLFVSIVLHEFAHSLVARRDGLPMRGITLFIFGGVAEMDREPPSAMAEFRMSIAGPLTSVALGVVFYLIALGTQGLVSRAVTAVFGYLAFINIVLAIFNMLPAFPLDGGRVLRSVLWRRSGDLRRATRTACKWGSGFGTGLIVLGVISIIFGNFIGGLWYFLIGLFLRGAAQSSLQQVEIRRALEGEPIARFMNDHPVTVPPETPVDDLVQDYFYRYHYSSFPVTEQSQLKGCVSTDELRAIPREDWPHYTAGEVARPCDRGNTIAPEADAVEALTRMTRGHYTQLMVAKDRKLLGIVTLKDLLNFLAIKLDLEGGSDEIRQIQEAIHTR
jgi:Zn-dependent protease/CBS domain-containing protein